MNPAVIEVMKLAEENGKLRKLVAAQSAMIDTLQAQVQARLRTHALPNTDASGAFVIGSYGAGGPHG